MGSAQSVTASSASSTPTTSEKLGGTPESGHRLERSGTVAVASTFKHEFSYEMSPDELNLVRRLVALTSSTPSDSPGEYPNPLYSANASGEAIQVAEQIMAKTKYAFNFVHHHESAGAAKDIRSVLERQKSGIPHNATTKLSFKKEQQDEVNRALDRDGSFDEERKGKRPQLEPIESQRDVTASTTTKSSESSPTSQNGGTTPTAKPDSKSSHAAEKSPSTDTDKQTAETKG